MAPDTRISLPLASRSPRTNAANSSGVLAEPEFREREITGKGYTGVGSTPDEFAAFVRSDLEAKGKLIRVSGAKAE